MGMKNSRARARTWPYPRYEPFVRSVRKAAAAWFESRKYPVDPKYSFILDSWQNWRRNIILTEVADYVEGEIRQRRAVQQGFPLHKYVHHGLSSQAMLFNLVGPLIARNDFSPLKTALEANGVAWPIGSVSAAFEVEDREVFNEDSGQPTSIDLVIRGDSSSSPIFIESKFVETEFGGCSVFLTGDCEGMNPARRLERCYLHHIGRQYWRRMQEHEMLVGSLADSPFCPFAGYYQFFREALFAIQNGGTFVLLHDSRNPSFIADGPDGQRGLFPFLTSLLPSEIKEKVKEITIAEVLAAAKASGTHDDWSGEFATKYGMV